MFARRLVRAIAATGVAASVLAGGPSRAASAVDAATEMHTEKWQPWADLLDVDPFTMPTEVGRLRGVEPATRCHGPVPTLATAVSRLGDALGRQDSLHAGVQLDPTAEQALARLVDCLATLVPHLPAYDGEELGEAPPALRSAWLGAMQDLLRLVDELPALDLPEGAEASAVCLDPLCLVQTGGVENNAYTADAVLVVDEGGTDVYRNNAGGASLEYLAPVALVVDRGRGADQYLPVRSDLYSPTIGAGIFGGVGVLVDEGGADVYRGIGGTMGAAYSGAGMLLDLGEANDLYDSPYGAGSNPGDSQKVDHGAGVYGGFGMLVDQGGSDRYQNAGVYSLGFGGAGGTGVLLDASGNDSYVNAAAFTTGLEGDIGVVSGLSIGVSEAGGAGVVLDGGGDDFYTCQAAFHFGCAGASYLGGLGLLYDRSGNDGYSVPATALFPFTPGGLGAGSLGGVGMFVDAGGADSYSAGSHMLGWGTAGLGLFLDLGGSFDRYTVVGPVPLVGSRGDNSTWADGAGTGIGTDGAFALN